MQKLLRWMNRRVPPLNEDWLAAGSPEAEGEFSSTQTLMLPISIIACCSILSITSRFNGWRSRWAMPLEWIWCKLKRMSLAMTWISPRLRGFPRVIMYSKRLGGRSGILIYSSYCICSSTRLVCLASGSLLARLATIFFMRDRLTRQVGSFAMKKYILFDLYMYSILPRLMASGKLVSARVCRTIKVFSALLNLDC